MECDRYVRELQNLQAAAQPDVNLIRTVLQCALTNLVVLARGVLGDFLPAGIVANVMVFDKAGGRLLLRCSTDYQSIESAEAPWKLQNMPPPGADKHPGICVRAFVKHELTLQPDMTGMEVRQGEPLKGMLAFPLIRRDQAFDGALAVINVVSFDANLIPPTPTDALEARIAHVQNIATNLNEIVRQCDYLR
jgi:hypothetical protein